eukprot:CAMPEP_0174265704 /NCGR_PEP_ID=MMETSP0439-20130205/27572_1 /TAXON_ID=0 /ORGANISM="Stereomyxa ramosa, Strain Chinc5" /LENGTH=402 /DNA_ID=CAMNT_0015352301 /DNA_START=51 /DNA_END=1256 /DNA_ORIENTATION=+
MNKERRKKRRRRFGGKKKRTANDFTLASSDIPQLVLDSILWLNLHHAYKSEGLFRVPGELQLVTNIITLFEKGKPVDLDKESNGNEHVIASVLKKFVRDMEIPLLTFELYDCFMATATIEKEEERLGPLKAVLKLLPQVNYNYLKVIAEFLFKVSAHEAESKMTAENLAIIFSVSILRPEEFDPANISTFSIGGQSTSLVACIIKHQDTLFAEDTEEEILAIKTKVSEDEQFLATIKEGTIKLALSIADEKRFLMELSGAEKTSSEEFNNLKMGGTKNIMSADFFSKPDDPPPSSSHDSPSRSRSLSNPLRRVNSEPEPKHYSLNTSPTQSDPMSSSHNVVLPAVLSKDPSDPIPPVSAPLDPKSKDKPKDKSKEKAKDKAKEKKLEKQKEKERAKEKEKEK